MQQKAGGAAPSALAGTHVNAEVSGGAVHLPAWGQSSGGVLQGDGGGEDGHGEPDRHETSGASEGPTVSRVDVRLEVRRRVVKNIPLRAESNRNLPG